MDLERAGGAGFSDLSRKISSLQLVKLCHRIVLPCLPKDESYGCSYLEEISLSCSSCASLLLRVFNIYFLDNENRALEESAEAAGAIQPFSAPIPSSVDNMLRLIGSNFPCFDAP